MSDTEMHIGAFMASNGDSIKELVDQELVTNLTAFSELWGQAFYTSTTNFTAFFPNGVFNEAVEFAYCLLNTYRDIQWIERATKKVCMVFTISNPNQGGSYGSTSVCFEISMAGMITSSVSSNSQTLLQKGNELTSKAIAITTCYTVLLALNSFYVIAKFLLPSSIMKHAVRGRKCGSVCGVIIDIVTLIIQFITVIQALRLFDLYNATAENIWNVTNLVLDHTVYNGDSSTSVV